MLGALSMNSANATEREPTALAAGGVFLSAGSSDASEFGSLLAEFADDANFKRSSAASCTDFQKQKSLIKGAIMSLSEDKVREELKKVVDPELFVNIVDLGLIYVVNLEQRDDEKYDVKIEMTMTSPMCPAGPQLVAQSKAVVEALEEVESAEVKVVMDPPWSPDKMTDEARDHLGIF